MKNNFRKHITILSLTFTIAAFTQANKTNTSLNFGASVYNTESNSFELITKPKSDTLLNSFNDNVRLVAELSDVRLQVKDSLVVTYKLYISPNVGISNYQLNDKKENENFEVQDIKMPNVLVQNETLNNKKYRSVILMKSILKPKQKGAFDLSVLELDVTAEIPTKNTDQFGRIITKKVTKTIKTDSVVINVI